jgi:pantoate--beta-alanine ligase
VSHVVSTRQELNDRLAALRAAGGRVALVPTMGALHEGHAALVREARRSVGPTDAVVVSVFVNPLQFGAGEDLDRYPRTLEADLEVCDAEGADLVLAPPVEEVYPGGEPEVTIDPGPLGSVLEGEVRPTHFRGVLTVVAKLFGLVRPDVAVFGEKDYQQLVLVRRMVADLCLGVEVVGVPTVREADGLALSSRNRYLSPEERKLALALSTALDAGAAAGAQGAGAVLAAAREVLDARPEVALDYLALTGPDLHAPPLVGHARLLVAGRVGTTRLIDNTPVDLSLVEPAESPRTSRTTGAR